MINLIVLYIVKCVKKLTTQSVKRLAKIADQTYVKFNDGIHARYVTYQ